MARLDAIGEGGWKGGRGTVRSFLARCSLTKIQIFHLDCIFKQQNIHVRVVFNRLLKEIVLALVFCLLSSANGKKIRATCSTNQNKHTGFSEPIRSKTKTNRYVFSRLTLIACFLALGYGCVLLLRALIGSLCCWCLL